MINPISGGKSKKHLPELIHQNVDQSQFDVEIFWWDEVSALEAKMNSFVGQNGYMAVAVGGDGTVNLIAKSLIGKPTILAILPMGSGNGLARQTGFNQSVNTFFQRVNNHKINQLMQIDVGLINEKPFVNIAGLGFDAHITTVFSKMKGRGFWSYAKAVISQFYNYPTHRFKISVGADLIHTEAFMINVANGTQWGNDFFIAPQATLDDGLLDLVVVKKPTFIQLIPFIIALRLGRSHSCVSYHRNTVFQISSVIPTALHVDGEPSGVVSKSDFSLLPKAIQLMDMR